MAKKITLVVFGVLFFIVSFQNCSEVDFEQDNSDLEQISNSNDAILINNGDLYTNSTNVIIDLNAGSTAKEVYLTNDPTCKSGGQWQTYQKQVPWRLDQTNATARVYARFKNKVDRISDCVADDILHDDLPPFLTLLERAPLESSSPQAEFRYVAIDDGEDDPTRLVSGLEQVKCYRDGILTECSNSKLLLYGLSEGLFSIRLVAVDRAGNETALDPYQWLVDLTPPQADILDGPGNVDPTTGERYSGSRTAIFLVEASDPVKEGLSSGLQGVQCQLIHQDLSGTTTDLGWSDCEQSSVSGNQFNVKFSNLEDGTYTFRVRAVDEAGNTSPEPYSVWRWGVTSSAPGVKLTRGPDPAIPSLVKYTQYAGATFTWEGIEPDKGSISGYRCNLDGGAISECSSGSSFASSLSEGQHTFQVWALSTTTDENGSPIESEEPATHTWIVDKTGPIVTIEPVGNWIKQRTPTFSFSASDTYTPANQLDYTCVLIDVTNNQEVARDNDCTASENYSFSGVTYKDSIKYSIQVTATDLAGNSGSDLESFQMDFSSPVISFNYTRYFYSETGEVSDTEVNLTVTSGDIRTLDSGKIEVNLSDSLSGINSSKTSCQTNFDNNNALKDCSWSYSGNVASIQITRAMLDALDFGNKTTLAFKFYISTEDLAGNPQTSTFTLNVMPGVRNDSSSLTMTPGSNAVDILFVLDPAGSMNYLFNNTNFKEKISNLIANVEAAATTDQGKLVDWRVALTSNFIARKSSPTAGESGLLYPMSNSALYIDANTTDYLNVFSTSLDSFDSEVSGSSYNNAIYASYLALNNYPGSTGFFRNDSSVAVIMITDQEADDANNADGLRGEEMFVNFIQPSILPKVHSFSAFGILNVKEVGNSRDAFRGTDYNSCGSLGGGDDLEQYQFVEQTGGHYVDICQGSTGDYTSVMDGIGEDINTRVRSIRLNCNPVQDPYSVKVLATRTDDGTNVTLPGGSVTTDGAGNYYYTFSDLLPVPADDSENYIVEVDYQCFVK